MLAFLLTPLFTTLFALLFGPPLYIEELVLFATPYVVAAGAPPDEESVMDDRDGTELTVLLLLSTTEHVVECAEPSKCSCDSKRIDPLMEVIDP